MGAGEVGGGGGIPLYKPYEVCAAPMGMVFEQFWSEIGRTNFDHFGLK